MVRDPILIVVVSSDLFVSRSASGLDLPFGVRLRYLFRNFRVIKSANTTWWILSRDNKWGNKKASIPEEWVPPAWADCTWFNSHQMSAARLVVLKWTSLNRCPVIATKCHYQGTGVSPVQWGPMSRRGGSLYSGVQCIIGNGHKEWRTDTYENITFSQLRVAPCG